MCGELIIYLFSLMDFFTKLLSFLSILDQHFSRQKRNRRNITQENPPKSLQISLSLSQSHSYLHKTSTSSRRKMGSLSAPPPLIPGIFYSSSLPRNSTGGSFILQFQESKRTRGSTQVTQQNLYSHTRSPTPLFMSVDTPKKKK